MKFVLKKLGVLEKAEFSLGDMTIICGQNNTGKTYATYALYGFLSHFHKSSFPLIHRGEAFNFLNSDIDKLMETGQIEIDLTKCIDKAPDIIKQMSRRYSKDLSEVFAASKDYFVDSIFSVEINPKEIKLKPIERSIGSAKNRFISMSNKSNKSLLNISIVAKKQMSWPKHIIRNAVAEGVVEIMLGNLLPKPFIASAERTGAAIFRKELDFARNRLIEEAGSKEDIDIWKLMFNVSVDYALPVKNNVEFTRKLESISKDKSFIADSHKYILDMFADIIGGDYIVSRNNAGLHYKPKKSGNIKLTMDESSSAVRSLLDIGFYLRHMAKKGDLLIVDEPELNLHPENQRKVARLLACLCNIGIKVFITTHSDYIVKELSTLVMLNKDTQRIKELADKKGYSSSEFLDYKKVKAYVAEQKLMSVNGNNGRKKWCNTLVDAETSEFGIDVGSFTNTILDMEEMQDEIIWGGEN